MRRSLKVRIYPSHQQTEFLNAQFGAVRFAYNKALFVKNYYYKKYQISLQPKKHIKPLLATAKRSRKYSWLSRFDSVALQQAVINLDTAFNNFFHVDRPARFPRFKTKRGKQSSYHCVGIRVGKDWIKIPKVSAIKSKIHRKVEGSIKSITLSRSISGKYFASLNYEVEALPSEKIMTIDESKVLGIDLGISNLLVDSEGNTVSNPRFLKKAEENLRRKQKALSRCQKGSNNFKKARLKVAKSYEKLVNVRQDFQHKLSRKIVDDNQAIVVETLCVKNLLKNKRLSKYIADVSWFSLVCKIEYKACARGKRLVKVSPWFASSKTCFTCKEKIKSLSLGTRQWDCPSCGTQSIDRDFNAALNIRHEGILKLRAEGLSVPANGSTHKTSNLPAAAGEVGSLAF